MQNAVIDIFESNCELTFFLSRMRIAFFSRIATEITGRDQQVPESVQQLLHGNTIINVARETRPRVRKRVFAILDYHVRTLSFAPVRRHPVILALRKSRNASLSDVS